MPPSLGVALADGPEAGAWRTSGSALEALPTEILLVILTSSDLSPQDLYSCARASRRLLYACEEASFLLARKGWYSEREPVNRAAPLKLIRGARDLDFQIECLNRVAPRADDRLGSSWASNIARLHFLRSAVRPSAIASGSYQNILVLEGGRRVLTFGAGE